MKFDNLVDHEIVLKISLKMADHWDLKQAVEKKGFLIIFCFRLTKKQRMSIG